ncbi:MAG: hypothetical protein IPL55_06080 [Saprospiraceae bacterium]|jgi:hypothetical protein|nr:hypothetical protein [Saprospiraceae bacterium]
MKNNKQKKNIHKPDRDELDKIKPKKKLPVHDQKINIKSNNFWKEIYEEDSEDFEKSLK